MGSNSRGLLLLAGVATAILLLAAWLVPSLHREVAIAPSPDHRLFLFSDTGMSNRTTIEQLPSEKTLGCVVRFASGVANPFAGMGISLISPRESQGLDLSNADSFSLEYRHIGTARISLFANVVLPDDTTPVRLEAPIPSITPEWKGVEGQCPDGAYVVPSSMEWRRITIPRSAFHIPDWWLEHHKSAKAFRLDGPERTTSVGIQIRGIPMGSPDTIEIRNILALNSTRPSLWFILASFIPLLVASGVAFTRTTSAKGNVPGPVPLDVPDRSSLEINALLTWLSANYQRNIDLESTARAVGIHSRRIAPLLKSAMGRTFPAHVNHLRIAEAQRLLVETDRQVAEIASTVGFADTKYFQRIFKAATGTTPGEWRDRQRSA